MLKYTRRTSTTSAESQPPFGPATKKANHFEIEKWWRCVRWFSPTYPCWTEPVFKAALHVGMEDKMADEREDSYPAAPHIRRHSCCLKLRWALSLYSCLKRYLKLIATVEVKKKRYKTTELFRRAVTRIVLGQLVALVLTCRYIIVLQAYVE